MSQAGIITASTGGGTDPLAVHTVTTQNGTATASGNNMNFNGYPLTPAAPQIGQTNATGDTFNYEDRTWLTAYVVDTSTTVGTRGTFSTLQSAINAASSGDTVFLRTSVTENITLKSGVNIVNFGGPGGNDITITGNIIDNGVSLSTVIDGIRLTNTGAAFLTLTGASSIINIHNSTLSSNGAAGISVAAGATAVVNRSVHNLGNNTASFFTGAGTITYRDSFGTNSGGSTVVSSAGILFCDNSNFSAPISGTNGEFNWGIIDTADQNVTAVPQTSAGTFRFFNSVVRAGTATPLTIAAGCTVNAVGLELNTSNTVAVSGAGTINFAPIVFSGSGSSNTVTTQTLLPYSTVYLGKGQVVNYTAPGAYPYTVLTTDYVIGVDTTAARTINLPASPRTGQTFRIKDATGTAGTNNITVTPAAGNIDGAATLSINSNYASVDLTYNGTQWLVL